MIGIMIAGVHIRVVYSDSTFNFGTCRDDATGSHRSRCAAEDHSGWQAAE